MRDRFDLKNLDHNFLWAHLLHFGGKVKAARSILGSGSWGYSNPSATATKTMTSCRRSLMQRTVTRPIQTVKTSEMLALVMQLRSSISTSLAYASLPAKWTSSLPWVGHKGWRLGVGTCWRLACQDWLSRRFERHQEWCKLGHQAAAQGWAEGINTMALLLESRKLVQRMVASNLRIEIFLLCSW